MNTRIRVVLMAALSSLGLALAVPAAHASVLSLLSPCSSETYSHPFAQWGDNADYTPVAGGSFESGNASWLLTGGAATSDGNESYNAGGSGDSKSLSLPAGSSATSPAMCTGIDHPTMRFFMRNTGASSSRLRVDVLYPGLLGAVRSQTLGYIGGSADWQPSDTQGLLVSNLLATLSLSRTAIAFRLTASDSSGKWSVDDVYLDPYRRG
jgi:hypothetical protein